MAVMPPRKSPSCTLAIQAIISCSPGVSLGREFLGLGASGGDFFGIAAVEGDPGPSDGEIRIFFHGCAPIVVAALEVEILVVLHSLPVKLTRLGEKRL